MKPPQSLISLLLAILCGGILVLFTDVEWVVVRWINCSPISRDLNKNIQVCR